MKIVKYFCVFISPPQLLEVIHRRGVQSHRVDQAEVSTASRICKNIKPWKVQNLFIECSTFYFGVIFVVILNL